MIPQSCYFNLTLTVSVPGLIPIINNDTYEAEVGTTNFVNSRKGPETVGSALFRYFTRCSGPLRARKSASPLTLY
jgi:hypothetical protein